MDFFVKRVKYVLRIILLIAIAFQIVLFGNIEVICGCVVSFLSLEAFNYTVFKSNIIGNHPVTFLAITGLECFTYFAPIFTLIDGNPITYKMENPNSTFMWQLIYICVTLIAFRISIKFTSKYPFIRNCLYRIGYFQPVSNKTLWFMGLCGLVAKVYLLTNQYGDDVTQGAGTVSIFLPFLMAPYCTMFRELFDSNYKYKESNNKTFIILYTVVLLGMAIASNSRNSIVTIIMGFFLMYFMKLLLHDTSQLKRFVCITKKKFITILIIFFVVTGPISDFAMAMVVVRSARSDLSAFQLMKETVDLVMDRESMDRIKTTMNKIENISNTDWDETYVANLFAARLCNYLVADKTIYYAEKGDIPNKQLMEYSIMRIKTIFPQPIVNFLFGHIDKSEINYSPMDCLLASRIGHNRQSYFVGGDVGLGIATFGYAFPIFQLFMYILLFSFLDQYVIRKNDIVVIPVITLISLYGFFYTFMAGNGILFRFISLFWAVPFGILLKVLLLKFTSKIFG